MRRYRPRPVLALAVLHLLGGGLGLAVTLFPLAVQARAGKRAAVPPAPTPAAVTPENLGATLLQRYREAVPHYDAVYAGEIAAGLLLDVLLLAGGVGLWNMRPWGRAISLAYAVMGIGYRLFGLIVGLAFYLPVTEAFMSEVATASPGMAAAAGDVRGTAVFGLWASFGFIAYPVAVLLILLRPRVAAAFREGAAPDEPAEHPDVLGAVRR